MVIFQGKSGVDNLKSLFLSYAITWRSAYIFFDFISAGLVSIHCQRNICLPRAMNNHYIFCMNL